MQHVLDRCEYVKVIEMCIVQVMHSASVCAENAISVDLRGGGGVYKSAVDR